MRQIVFISSVFFQQLILGLPVGAITDCPPPVSECPKNRKLCIVPIKLYFLEPTAFIHLQTNNGSNMLLQLQNESNVNIAELKLSCGATSEHVRLGVYAPDNLRRYNRDWAGCLLKVSNITQKSTPAEVMVFLVGQ
ncbi:MAG: hypothetical protein AB3N28_15820 [Kordiimonas sp.]